ncbi:hypothetical protein FLK61_29105 [Paenalkalicoccus suaedae]|uniref:PRC-barrel domain-containing protein n=1 Tax=Paenalkalicoccus suaedae TaxID=2592382 RepID=A0A859FDY7_9BACI|nr:PRC-barrel domain-containing protein [Paenalkalicoccus suaedae]QKS70794.1 hypothetical protein FLK61_29105 [Paenalkalicoccus suaedae]
MLTFQRLSFTPVFFRSKCIGEVSDLMIEHSKVTALLVKRSYHKKTVVPLSAVSIHDTYLEAQRITHAKRKEVQYLSAQLGTFLHDKEGLTLGMIRDVYFDMDTGRITAYELTEGLFTEWQKGVRKVPAKRI